MRSGSQNCFFPCPLAVSGSRTFSLANFAGRKQNCCRGSFPEKTLGHPLTYELPYKPISAWALNKRTLKATHSHKMKTSFKTTLILISGVALGSVTTDKALANAALELTSGASDIIIQDNFAGLDLNLSSGQILWAGTINGWTFTVAVGDTKPLVGSATSPILDLSVAADTPGNGSLTVKFTDTGFGPTSGSIDSSTFQNGTGIATMNVLVDPNNAQFGGVATSGASLTGPYSITLVDTFSVGTIIANQHVTAQEGTSVSDGGCCAALLSFALMGLEGLRRKVSK